MSGITETIGHRNWFKASGTADHKANLTGEKPFITSNV